MCAGAEKRLTTVLIGSSSEKLFCRLPWNFSSSSAMAVISTAIHIRVAAAVAIFKLFMNPAC